MAGATIGPTKDDRKCWAGPTQATDKSNGTGPGTGAQRHGAKGGAQKGPLSAFWDILVWFELTRLVIFFFFFFVIVMVFLPISG